MSGTIAIVGRPNVGKSALFNRIVGRRIAIVHDLPGVTRDRISAEAEWRGMPFTLVDTGGIGLLRGEKSGDPLVEAAFTQVRLAIEAADVVVLVVNFQEGVVPLDREVAARLREGGKEVVVAVNKVDSAEAESGVPEFAALGFERLYPVSAIHGRGIGALLDGSTARLPIAEVPEGRRTKEGEEEDERGDGARGAVAPEGEGPEQEGAALRIAIVGRPNVGKSSILNALTASERVIVSPVPGTTRDAVDVPFVVETEGRKERYILVDTAGIRKDRRVADSIEFFSVKRAEHTIERSDLVVFVLDAEGGILEQDKKIADRIVEARKGCVVVVNKWDLYEAQVRRAQEEERVKAARGKAKAGRGESRPMTSLSEFGAWVQEKLFFLDYAPVVFTSAKSGFNLDRLLEAVRFVAAQLQQRIPTALLNRTLQAAIERRQPISATGAHLKFFYATQVRQAPPTFLLFVNRDELFSPQYTKYLAGELRKAFGYEGCPIVLRPRPRPQSEPASRPGASKPAPGSRGRGQGGGRGRGRGQGQRGPRGRRR